MQTKKIIFILIFIIISLTNHYIVFAENDDMLNQFFEKNEFSDIEKVFEKNEYSKNFDIKKTIQDLTSGNSEISPAFIFDYFIKNILKEVYENINIIRNVLIICIIGAIVRCFSQSLQNKEMGNLTFYIIYIVTVILLFSSFSLCIEIMKSTIHDISEFMKALIPLIISLMIMSGETINAYLFTSVIFSASEFIIMFVESFASPLIITASVMQILNYMSEQEVLSKFSELIKNFVSYGIKGCAIVFMSVLSFYKISGQGSNILVNKTAKAVVNMVPVVGDVFSGTMESFSAFSGVIKTGVGLAFILGLVIIFAIPIIKIIAIIFIYKFTASIIQPICDKRIVSCIDDMGKYSGVILSIVIITSIVFIFSIILVIGISGG